MHPNCRGRTTLKRCIIRGFAVLMMFVIVLDTLPRSWTWLSRPQYLLTSVLNRAGLWQGEWPMFAPNPILNNGWFTAEIHAEDGTISQWKSPYWSDASSWDKFVGFRHVDYYNRLPLSGNVLGAEDFVDYLARRDAKPPTSIKLYRNRVQLHMPEDGSLPARDEIEWMFSSELVTRRSYQP